MKQFIVLLFLLFVLAACNSKKNSKVIVIQPFGDFSEMEASKVLEEIKKVNPHTVLRTTIPFPSDAFYKPRNRYRAEKLLQYLKETIGKDSVIIGLSHADISTKKGNVEDWGVMGLGYRPGNSCVVSRFRLAKKNKQEQFYKVALHELGHTEGLPHCRTQFCLMRDAEGGNPLDKEKNFCKPCKQFLKSKHWNLH